ncbi:MAG: polymer-forming cytoskeletal protein [Saprospirales bacterium]|nr:polymer-forming cytoskeletal protein [Saprospirales bacterium]MBK8491140.1 polymer-forming cytoskeletal protein [Saprospirales bacterium]
MFGSNKSKETTKSNTSAPSTSHSFNNLVQGTTVEGDIQSKSDIRIDGHIKGSLKCESKVIIGPTGSIEGEVGCVSAVIEGRFQGTLVVEDLLTIKETANVNGQIRYGKLVVQPGAVLVGDLRMNGVSGAAKPGNTATPEVKRENIPGNAKTPKENAG